MDTTHPQHGQLLQDECKLDQCKYLNIPWFNGWQQFGISDEMRKPGPLNGALPPPTTRLEQQSSLHTRSALRRTSRP